MQKTVIDDRCVHRSIEPPIAAIRSLLKELNIIHSSQRVRVNRAMQRHAMYMVNSRSATPVPDFDKTRDTLSKKRARTQSQGPS